MAFIVVYDANVLYPNTLRDLLIRISQAGLCTWANEQRSGSYGVIDCPDVQRS
jgi:hypothetical protein